jgi:hypothetical protein
MDAITACMAENLGRNYRDRNNHILSDSQAAIKPLGDHSITSKLVWYSHQSLLQLAKHNSSGHEGTAGNKMADQTLNWDLNVCS